ncbi:MAG: PLP-dependent aminotransferase family protein [Butyricicoccus sp.]|nr:PLP-dependent aminotransferase family protein [Butyricicoccus sp.]
MYNITLNLEPGAKTPMYEQLYRYFAAEIHAGRMSRGEKLPSKRALCAHLGVSRSTVETAYALLCAEGYVDSRPKSGYYVSDFVTLESAPEPQEKTASEEHDAPRRASPEFDFSTASVDTSEFPYSSWAKLNKEIVYSSPELLQIGQRQGDAALRQALCDFLGEYRGVKCSAEQIVVGAGMEYLSMLLLSLLPESAVFALEDPGYASIYNTVRHALRPLRLIPLDGQGMSAAALERSDATVAYITPSHQFPMGVTMPATRRSELLHWAARGRERYIIEDDYDSEFRYGLRPVPAMQSMDGGGRVVYVGTFSRSVAPSIRIAYMVLPERLLERYRALSGFSRSTVSRYEQAVMARFLSEGFYARYLRRVGNLYSRRRERLISALEGIGGVRVSGSGGGIHFLLTNPRFSESELLRRAEAQGIALRGLSAYCRECASAPSTLVVGYGGLKDEKISQAAERLRLAWE